MFTLFLLFILVAFHTFSISAGAIDAAKLPDNEPSAFFRFSSSAFGVVDEVFELGGGGEKLEFSSFTRRSSAPFCKGVKDHWIGLDVGEVFSRGCCLLLTSVDSSISSRSSSLASLALPLLRSDLTMRSRLLAALPLPAVVLGLWFSYRLGRIIWIIFYEYLRKI